MSTPDENKAVILRNIEGLNAGNLDILDETYAPDYVQHNPIPGFSDASHKEFEKQAVAMLRAAFPDYHQEVEDILAEGDKVAIRSTISGTHRGELMGIPPTGKRVAMSLITITRFDDKGKC